MPLYNTSKTYGTLAKSLHWLIGLLIIGMLAVGLYMVGLPVSPDKFKLYGLHKSIGITVLALVALRLIWKWINESPLLPDALTLWEKRLAKLGHFALYILMFAMPLSGWAMSSAAGLPVSVFGLFTLPDLVAPDKTLKANLQQVHETLAWALMAMIGLHVLAALLHHFYYKDKVLLRMLPFANGETDARLNRP